MKNLKRTLHLHLNISSFKLDRTLAQSVTSLSDVNAVEIVGTEGGVALRALPLACIVTRLHTLEAEDMEALCQHGILYTRVAARTRQTGLQEQETSVISKGDQLQLQTKRFSAPVAYLVFINFLVKYLVTVSHALSRLLGFLDLPAQFGDVLLMKLNKPVKYIHSPISSLKIILPGSSSLAHIERRACTRTCARRALKDSFSLEMLFSITSSRTSFNRCCTPSS